MAKHGKWDIGCGTYSWHIVGPPIDPKTPLQLFDQQCYAENVFPDHDDIQESDVSVDAVTACGRLPETMGPGDSWYKTLGSSQSGDLDFGVEWTEGCVTDVDRQSVKNPLGVDGNPNWCLWLLFQDWKNCKCIVIYVLIGASVSLTCIKVTMEASVGGVTSAVYLIRSVLLYHKT